MIFIELSAYVHAKKLSRDSYNIEKNSYKCCIENCIKNELLENSEVNDFDRYLDKLKEQWEDNILENLKSLYNENELIGFKDVEGIECYIFKENVIQEKTKISLKLLLLVEKDDVDSAINIVYKKLNKFLRKKKINFSTNRKIKIYLTGEDNDDIVDDEVYSRQYVEVDLKKDNGFDTYIIIKNAILIIFIFIFINISYKYSDNEGLKNVMYGIIASIIFSIIIDIISKAIEWSNNKYKIVIRNISTFAQEQAKTRRNPHLGLTVNNEEVDELVDPELN